MSSSKATLIITASIASLVVAAAAVFGIRSILNGKKSILSSKILKSADFVIYMPSKNDPNFTIDPASVKYSVENETKILTFSVKNSGTNITFSEQSYPDILIFDKLVNSINPYNELSTKLGIVDLGRPKNLNGLQTAVVNPTGDLIFVNPDRSLTDDQWKSLFNSLQTVN